MANLIPLRAIPSRSSVVLMLAVFLGIASDAKGEGEFVWAVSGGAPFCVDRDGHVIAAWTVKAPFSAPLDPLTQVLEKFESSGESIWRKSFQIESPLRGIYDMADLGDDGFLALTAAGIRTAGRRSELCSRGTHGRGNCCSARI
jgi:hypothetical protein